MKKRDSVQESRFDDADNDETDNRKGGNGAPPVDQPALNSLFQNSSMSAFFSVKPFRS